MSEKGGQKRKKIKGKRKEETGQRKKEEFSKEESREETVKGDKGRRTWIHSFQLFLCSRQHDGVKNYGDQNTFSSFKKYTL